MKSRFLFPHQTRIWGYVCLLAYAPVMVIKKIIHDGYNHIDHAKSFADASSLFNSEHLLIALAFTLTVLGLLLIAFSKEKIEDEQIVQLRLDSLQWAIYFNYFILICSLFLSDLIHYREVMLSNLWAPLVFFIIRFRWKIYQLNRSISIEERIS